MGTVAKSYMRKGFLIYEDMRKYLVIHEGAAIYDFATAPFCFFLHEKNFGFFISAGSIPRNRLLITCRLSLLSWSNKTPAVSSKCRLYPSSLRALLTLQYKRR